MQAIGSAQFATLVEKYARGNGFDISFPSRRDSSRADFAFIFLR